MAGRSRKGRVSENQLGCTGWIGWGWFDRLTTNGHPPTIGRGGSVRDASTSLSMTPHAPPRDRVRLRALLDASRRWHDEEGSENYGCEGVWFGRLATNGRRGCGAPRARFLPAQERRGGAYVELSWSRMLDQSLPEPPPLLATMVPSRPMPTYVACERMPKACGTSDRASTNNQS